MGPLYTLGGIPGGIYTYPQPERHTRVVYTPLFNLGSIPGWYIPSIASLGERRPLCAS